MPPASCQCHCTKAVQGDSHSCIVGHRGRNRGAGVTGNPIRAYTDPGGSDPLAGSDSLLNLATHGNRLPDDVQLPSLREVSSRN